MTCASSTIGIKITIGCIWHTKIITFIASFYNHSVGCPIYRGLNHYADTFEEEEPVDIMAVQAEIEEREQKLAGLKENMSGFLKELQL